MKNNYKFIFLIMFITSSINAQNLLEKLDKEFNVEEIDEIATFKTTRIGLSHSIETRKKGALQLSLYFRYWDTNAPSGQNFLADKVSTRYGLDYAFTDNFTLGIGYTNYDKLVDGYFKYQLLKQTKDSNKRWFSLTLVQTISHQELTSTIYDVYESVTTSENSYAFVTQALFARKFNPNLSLQITPSFIYRNKNNENDDPTSQFAIGIGGRHRLSKHTSFVSEYNYVLNSIDSIETYNTFLVGINWEVRNFIFQFHLTNARSFAEDLFLTKTTNNFNFRDPNLHFGFNTTYVIQTKRRK